MKIEVGDKWCVEGSFDVLPHSRDLILPVSEWIEHTGNERPVPGHVIVDVEFDDGFVPASLSASAFCWGEVPQHTRIVKYRIVDENQDKENLRLSIARTILFEARCHTDRCRDAEEYWFHTGETGRRVALKQAEAVLEVVHDVISPLRHTVAHG